MQDPALYSRATKTKAENCDHFIFFPGKGAQPTKKIYLVVVNRFYLVVILSAMLWF